MEPFGHQDLTLFFFFRGNLIMFIVILNAKVDFLQTYKLIQLNRKTPFKESLETLKLEGSVNRMNVSPVEIVNQVNKYY